MPERSGYEMYSNLNGANNAANVNALVNPTTYGAAPVARELTRKQKHNKKSKSYKTSKFGLNIEVLTDVNPKNIVSKEAIIEMKKIREKVKNKKNIGGDLVKMPKNKMFKV
jgi:hypothetical protein